MKIVITYFSLCCTLLCYAHVSIALKIELDSANTDSTKVYYQKMNDKLGIYLYGINKYSRFGLTDLQTGDEIRYSPNESFNQGIGFTYRWFGLGFAFKIGALNDDEERYGKTKRLDFQADFFSKKWTYGVNFQYYKGFYWEREQSFLDNTTIYIRPDMQTFGFGVSGMHVFNHDKFSFKAVFSFNEWQRHSAGTFLLGGGISFYGVFGDSTIVPTDIENGFDSLQAVTQINTSNFGVLGGYAHSFVIKEKWFITLGLILGPSIQSMTGSTMEDVTTISDAGFGLRTKSFFAFGFANAKHYFGLSNNNDNYLLSASDHSQLEYSWGKFRLFYGRRFNVGKKRKK